MRRLLSLIFIVLLVAGSAYAVRVQVNDVPATITDLKVTLTSVFTPSAAQAITAVGDAILANATIVEVNPDANYTLTSTPHVADGTEGQIVIITADPAEANTVTLQDQGTLAGTNVLLLNSIASRAIGATSSIALRFDGADWREIYYNAAIDISADTNLAVSTPIVLTGDTVSLDTTLIDATTWSDGSNASNTWTFDVSGTDHTMIAGNDLMTFSGGVTVTGNILGPNVTSGADPGHTHSVYLNKDGSVALTSDWDAGGQEIRSETFESDIATGTAPFTIASTTVVTNLNVDTTDGFSLDQSVVIAGTPQFARLGVGVAAHGSIPATIQGNAQILDTSGEDRFLFAVAGATTNPTFTIYNAAEVAAVQFIPALGGAGTFVPEIGIGMTSAPDGILEVRGTGYFKSTGTGEERIQFFPGGDTTNPFIYMYSDTEVQTYAFEADSDSWIVHAGNFGFGTSGPDRELDVLHASAPQVRMTHTDGTVYTDFQTDANGYLTITPSGGQINMTNANGLDSSVPMWLITNNDVTSGQGNGAQITAGNDAGDIALLVEEQDGTDALIVDGASSVFMPQYGDGDVTFSGGTGLITTSSSREEKNIDGEIDDALELLLRYPSGKYYTWKNPARGTNRQFGFISQDVHKVHPEAAPLAFGEDGTERWGLYTRATVALMVQGLQEQQAQIDHWKERFNELQDQITKLEQQNGGN